MLFGGSFVFLLIFGGVVIIDEKGRLVFFC